MQFSSAYLKNRLSELPIERTDWFYRMLVPKSPLLNMAMRRYVTQLGYDDPEFAKDICEVCRRDLLFYVNVFGFTINPKDYPDQPVRPFITYPYQDVALLELQKHIGEEDILILKSRDMGASWMCLIALEHRWHFDRNQLFLLTSEKEELVEGDSEKALFSKLDFWWNHLPTWLTPEMNRKKSSKHCRNMDTESAFNGEATVENMATGDRQTAILLDEASKMPNAGKIATSTRDVTNSRLFNSTPNGRYGTGEAFYRKARNPSTRKLFLHWSEHPEKRKGLYRMDGDRRIPLDESYNWRDDYDFNQLRFKPGRMPRSEWYDRQVNRADTLKEIAQELDIDFIGSGDLGASSQAIEVMKKTICEPHYRGRLSVNPEDQSLEFLNTVNGPALLWCELTDSRPPRGQYAVGVDISGGTGTQFSAESAIVVMNRVTGEQVFEYADKNTSPEDWCDVSVAVAKWFWNAYLIPEVNGIGGQWVKRFQQLSYANVYRRLQKHIGFEKVTEYVGYHSDGPAGLLVPLQIGALRGRRIIRSSRVVDQLMEYEIVNGNWIHAGSQYSDSHADKNKLHGDVAIAAGCASLGVFEVSRREIEQDATPEKPEPGTYGYRMAMYEREDQQESDLVFS